MLRHLPKVILHEHLDGSLRPHTVHQLAEQAGHRLPVSDPDRLAEWFNQSGSHSLERYLTAFSHTVAVMQTRRSLRRVAAEAVEDLSTHGVVYAEIRFAPHLHTTGGLSLQQVVEAVADGLTEGSRLTGMGWSLILCALRHTPTSVETARLAIDAASAGVVGFDLAGPEAGYPAVEHLPAIEEALNGGIRVTLHAGEAAGPASIQDALACGAERIGHGVEVIEDCDVAPDRILETGPLATEVLDRQIPMEMCIQSNLDTKGWAPGHHPVGLLHRAGFAVTLNTDNRLMSSTTPTHEYELAVRQHSFSIDDLATVTRRALDAAFCGEHSKDEIWERRIAPAYRENGATVQSWR
ncbi:MAG: adenosine deaminase [Acidimicrobiia bacterium]|nr:adenosine deaminase [Acidimicrobiia bacterium]